MIGAWSGIAKHKASSKTTSWLACKTKERVKLSFCVDDDIAAIGQWSFAQFCDKNRAEQRATAFGRTSLQRIKQEQQFSILHKSQRSRICALSSRTVTKVNKSLHDSNLAGFNLGVDFQNLHVVDMSIANSQDTLQTSHFIVLSERTRRAGPLRFHVEDEGLAIPQPRTPDTFWGLNVPPSIRSHLIEVNGLIFDPWSDTGNTLGTGSKHAEEEVETLRRRPLGMVTPINTDMKTPRLPFASSRSQEENILATESRRGHDKVILVKTSRSSRTRDRKGWEHWAVKTTQKQSCAGVNVASSEIYVPGSWNVHR
ncbi:hypothetical protein BJ322DRAFT_1016653 [Thelephora terrestris]|uniref:Uncharacterized protein n=1 Tax=Thelephora terrestris TaxID=56493 RepID=A0A9P6HRG5_9AGAM|nr:hypothetical protein BJ322DRAFT_1016653 [Thelephora terrestris]